MTGEAAPSSEEKSDVEVPSEPPSSRRRENFVVPTQLDGSRKNPLVGRGKKRKRIPEAKTDSGRHEELLSQANGLEEKALAALQSAKNRKKKQCVRLAMSLLKATKEWIKEH